MNVPFVAGIKTAVVTGKPFLSSFVKILPATEVLMGVMLMSLMASGAVAKFKGGGNMFIYTVAVSHKLGVPLSHTLYLNEYPRIG